MKALKIQVLVLIIMIFLPSITLAQDIPLSNELGAEVFIARYNEFAAQKFPEIQLSEIKKINELAYSSNIGSSHVTMLVTPNQAGYLRSVSFVFDPRSDGCLKTLTLAYMSALHTIGYPNDQNSANLAFQALKNLNFESYQLKENNFYNTENGQHYFIGKTFNSHFNAFAVILYARDDD